MTGSRGKKNQKAGTRAAAAQAVDQVLTAGRSLDVALSHVIDERLEARDQALIRALSFGALRWHHRHRLIINELLSKPLRARDQILEALLSVGLFQLLDTRQPGYASVSATVEATRELKKPQAAGLVNAMLRRFLREKDALLQRVLNQDEGRHAHPQWLIDQLNADWGDQAADIMACAQKPPPMWLRVNAHRATSERYLQQLDAVGIAASAEANLSGAVLLEKPVSVQTLPGFDEGVASVQDAAAQLAALLLDMKPGMRVLDACAAPGGKTGHILESVGGQAQLTAVDMDPLRNERVKDNVQRLGYTAEIVTADILQWAEDQALHGTFDRILIDAPCSATGVIRRHPD
ncbi:MAG: 16S rRNA (cytosine(967)-C(5))-methyltransferase RsmB, partial [Gammaproteobacteria bacterium]|nr:16S rRNA (cytosine(967)-C(5))-methyltransferase RsmB [Gammaproteobacteria bacterium]